MVEAEKIVAMYVIVFFTIATTYVAIANELLKDISKIQVSLMAYGDAAVDTIHQMFKNPNSSSLSLFVENYNKYYRKYNNSNTSITNISYSIELTK